MAESVTDALNGGKPYDPYSVITRGMGQPDLIKQGQIYERELPEFMRQESAARSEAALSETRARREKAQAETAAEQEFATARKSAFGEYEQTIQPRPMFEPTKFDEEAAGKSAGITALIGAIAGAVSARAALKSMEGFTRGARQGRADLYNSELKQFEQNLKAWEDNAKVARQKLTDVIDMLGTNKTAALAKAKELDPLLQDGVALSKVRQQDFVGAAKVLDSGIKAVQQAKLEAFKAAQKGDGAGIKLTAEPAKAFREAEYGFGKALSIEQKLSNPDVRRKLDSSGVLRTLLEDPKEMTSVNKLFKQAIFRNLPKEAQDLVVDLADMRNAYYKEKSGSAVTGSEAARNFFAVVQPSDNSSEILLKLKNIKAGHARTMQNTITDYKDIPEATRQRVRSMLLQSMPAQPAAPGAAATQGQDIESVARARTGSYEPDKYNYGFEDGRFYREPK